MPPNYPGLSPAASDLGVGLGDMLGQQAAGETEEQRKKRIAQQQQQAQGLPGGTLATMALFGGGMGGGLGR